jgi:hypothetical protein
MSLPPPSEYSERFDQLRKAAIAVSYHKYGPAKNNFHEGRVDAVASLRRKLLAYERTGNTEYLVDVANYAMFEFMFPIHKDAHFKPTDDDRSTLPVGTPINMEKPE